MKLTVATVALNAADDLPLTLESIVGQDYPDIELLVVDGASWDDSAEVLARYEDAIDRLAIVEDGGIFDAMNRAAGLASGAMILFLNAGDRFHSADSVSKVMARRRPTADIVYGNHIYRRGGVEGFRPSWDFRMAMEALRRGAIGAQWLERFPAHQATMTRTELLREMKYDAAFRVCADHDFFLRAVDLGAEAQYIDEIVSIYVGGGFSERQGSLLKSEWNALHRRFSTQPAAIDAFYYGGRSPFRGTRGPAAGEVVSGLGEEVQADAARGIAHPFRWLSAEGARILAPGATRATGLVLSGTNPFARQRLEVYCAGSRIADTVVPSGQFTVDIGFTEAVAPGVVIDLVPEFGERIGDGPRFAALAVRDFDFKGDATTTPRRTGETIRFNRASEGENAELLGPGWYQFEPSFVWSRGRLSEVRVATKGPVANLTIEMRPNPAIPGQTCAISVNGQTVLEAPVGGQMTADVRNVWRHDGRDNVIAFRPSLSGNVGEDPRDLGVALESIALG